jgi:glycerophosphoryl diester phosphodiesterase
MTNDWPYPRIVAHRGGGSLAPENTLAAIRLGQSLGYRAHEFDVKLSKDNVAMLLHDATLERTTSGRGDAGILDWAALATLDAGAWHSPEHRGEAIARFDEAARLLKSKGTVAHVEIKPSPGREEETGAQVAALAAEFWKAAPVAPLLSSFSFEALSAAQRMAPELPRGWLSKEITEDTWARAARLAAVSIHTDHRKLERAHVQRAHDEGVRLLAYTVNEVARAEELFGWGVDGMFTDNLREFAQRFPAALKAG